MSARVCADHDEAVAGTPDGATVLVGGFGMAGMPVELIDALIRRLETFLLELGGDFAFVGRQRRLRIDDDWDEKRLAKELEKARRAFQTIIGKA